MQILITLCATATYSNKYDSGCGDGDDKVDGGVAVDDDVDDDDNDDLFGAATIISMF